MKIFDKLLKSLNIFAMALVLASCYSNAVIESDASGDENPGTLTGTNTAAGGHGNTVPHDTASHELKNKSDLPTYMVATLEYFPPFVMRDELRNSTGFDVDVLTAIGEREGFSPIFVPVKWDDAFTVLDRGQRDLLASGISILPERQFNYDFSEPYLTSTFSALCMQRNGSDKRADFKSLFGDRTIRFVTQKNSAGESKLAQLLDGDLSNVLTVDTQYDEVRQVIQNNADVAVDISRVMSYYIDRYPENNLYLLTDPEAKVDNLGFVFKKGNTKLVQKINDGLKKIKDDGTYDKIYRKWFGNNPM